MLGLATPFQTQNYGTKLQAFAMQNLFSDLGYDVEVISYIYVSDTKSKIKNLLSPKKIKSVISSAKSKNANSKNPEYCKCISERNKEFNDFVNSHLHTTRTFSTIESLAEYSKKYEAVICGSDQIWLPLHIKKQYYSLEFVPNGVRRIAYAPSIGIDTIEKKDQKIYSEFLAKMDSVSCREISGCNLINKLSGKSAQIVLDPTLMVKKEVWDTLSGKDKVVDGDYIFCYFLGNNSAHRQKVVELSKLTGCKIVCLPHITNYVAADSNYADLTPYNIGPDKFINLIKHAKYVCTDSFHGSVFSTIFEKEYFVFQRFSDSDKGSTNNRLSSLITNLGIESRKISDDQLTTFNWSDNIKCKINYSQVNTRLNDLRDSSMSYIKTSLSGIEPVKELHINITDKHDCCGCNACADACPKNCIKMEADAEGFVYPKVDTANCINCSMCINSCPIKNYKKGNGKFTPYSAINNDNLIRKESTSGGIFTPLAKKVIEDGGVVIGASFDDNFQVHHTIVDDLDNLWRFRSSKYVQSNTLGIYRKTKQLLAENKTVLFSGTPCHIRALKSYLKRDYNNLICIDLFCHGVPSPKVWSKYLEFANPKHNNIENISFRDKRISWEDYSLSIKFTNGEQSSFWKDDPYARAFGFSVINRPSCSTCRLKSFPRISDITLGDLWKISEIFPDMADHKGTSFVLVNTDKGKQLFDSIQNEISIKEIPESKFKTTYPIMGRPTKSHKNRNLFFSQLESQPFDSLAMKCSTVDKHREFVIKRNRFLNKIGLLSVMQKLKKMF